MSTVQCHRSNSPVSAHGKCATVVTNLCNVLNDFTNFIVTDVTGVGFLSRMANISRTLRATIAEAERRMIFGRQEQLVATSQTLGLGELWSNTEPMKAQFVEENKH